MADLSWGMDHEIFFVGPGVGAFGLRLPAFVSSRGRCREIKPRPLNIGLDSCAPLEHIDYRLD